MPLACLLAQNHLFYHMLAFGFYEMAPFEHLFRISRSIARSLRADHCDSPDFHTHFTCLAKSLEYYIINPYLQFLLASYLSFIQLFSHPATLHCFNLQTVIAIPLVSSLVSSLYNNHRPSLLYSLSVAASTLHSITTFECQYVLHRTHHGPYHAWPFRA